MLLSKTADDGFLEILSSGAETSYSPATLVVGEVVFRLILVGEIVGATVGFTVGFIEGEGVGLGVGVGVEVEVGKGEGEGVGPVIAIVVSVDQTDGEPQLGVYLPTLNKYSPGPL